MSGSGFIKLNRGPETDSLMRHHDALSLLMQIALRARRTLSPINEHNLSVGEALIGDYESIGLTERRYRTAKDRLENWELATFKGTSKGTVAILVDSTIFDINPEGSAEQNAEQVTDERRTSDEQATSNKNGKNDKNGEEGKEISLLPFLSPEFKTAWTDWEQSRKEAGKPIKPTTRKLQLSTLKKMGEARGISALIHSATSGYQGLFEPTNGKKSKPKNNEPKNYLEGWR